MCDPVTALVVAGVAITAGSQVYSGMAANNNAKFQAQIADINAKNELGKRVDADNKNNMDQMRHWRQVSQRIGMQRAQLSASGVDVNFGSAIDLQTDTAMLGGEDSAVINQNFANTVNGYEINANNYKMQAIGKRAEGKGALIGGYMAAAGTLLGGAAQMGKMGASPAGAR